MGKLDLKANDPLIKVTEKLLYNERSNQMLRVLLGGESDYTVEYSTFWNVIGRIVMWFRPRGKTIVPDKVWPWQLTFLSLGKCKDKEVDA